jgi:hypothetical protein
MPSEVLVNGVDIAAGLRMSSQYICAVSLSIRKSVRDIDDYCEKGN